MRSNLIFYKSYYFNEEYFSSDSYLFHFAHSFIYHWGYFYLHETNIYTIKFIKVKEKPNTISTISKTHDLINILIIS